MSAEEDRHSRALEAELISDPNEKAKAEVRNGLRQFDAVLEAIEFWTHTERKFKLRPSLVLQLHRVALEGISSYAGNFRPAGIKIGGSKHQPVEAYLVPEKVEELCDYVNEHWDKSAMHLAAYVLWRLNWIHPFTDGNGRTSRALSYLMLCLRLGYALPGVNTIPEQIASNKGPYYRALELSDEASRKGTLDLSAFEELLSGLLANQLVSVHLAATSPKKA
jgi:Fic family protein